MTASRWARPHIPTAKETQLTEREPEASFREAAAGTPNAERRGAYLVLMCNRGAREARYFTGEKHPTPHLFSLWSTSKTIESSVFSQGESERRPVLSQGSSSPQC